MFKAFTHWFAAASPPTPDNSAARPPMKWLPVIDTESCSGCGRCLEVCEHRCLGMDWSFATLLRPGDCGSEGRCMDACPHGVIRMDWVESTGDEQVGVWREQEDPDNVPARC